MPVVFKPLTCCFDQIETFAVENGDNRGIIHDHLLSLVPIGKPFGVILFFQSSRGQSIKSGVAVLGVIIAGAGAEETVAASHPGRDSPHPSRNMPT